VADNPFIFDGLAISATISLGIVNTLSLESPTPEALVNIADSALYRAKDNGRNRIEVEPDFLAESLRPERDEGSSLNSVAH
jgi:PleD family two-component response regulator